MRSGTPDEVCNDFDDVRMPPTTLPALRFAVQCVWFVQTTVFGSFGTSSRKLLGWRPSLLGWRPLLLANLKKLLAKGLHCLRLRLRVFPR